MLFLVCYLQKIIKLCNKSHSASAKNEILKNGLIWVQFSWEPFQIVHFAICIAKQNSFHYLGCHHIDHIWEITHAGVVYVDSIGFHGIQWICTIFTTLPCQGKVRSRDVKLFLIWIVVLHQTVWHQFCKKIDKFSKFDPCRAKKIAKKRRDFLPFWL